MQANAIRVGSERAPGGPPGGFSGYNGGQPSEGSNDARTGTSSTPAHQKIRQQQLTLKQFIEHECAVHGMALQRRLVTFVLAFLGFCTVCSVTMFFLQGFGITSSRISVAVARGRYDRSNWHDRAYCLQSTVQESHRSLEEAIAEGLRGSSWDFPTPYGIRGQDDRLSP